MEKEAHLSSVYDLLSSKVIEDLKLDEKDLKIIELFLTSLLEGREGFKATEVLIKVEGKSLDALRSYTRLIKLIQCGVLEAVYAGPENPLEVLFTKIKLSNHFLSVCFEGTSGSEADVIPYPDNQEYLSDQCKRVDLLCEINDGLIFKSEVTSCSSSLRQMRLEYLEERIAKRLKITGQTFPLERLKKRHKLNKIDELAVIAVLSREMRNSAHFEAQELNQLIKLYPFEKDKPKNPLVNGVLLKKKILEIDEDHHLAPFSIVSLNEKIKMVLLGEDMAPKKVANGFFEVISPKVTLDEVILHPATCEEIGLACHKIKGAGSKKLKEWGVLNNLQNKSTSKSATILFYGPPGTGKTLSAHAIAAHLNRELLIFDCSRVLGMWVGQSEKNTRKIFDEYRTVSKGQRNPPVLLLNEADQFLHKRIEASRSTDHMYNQMQNIFLEQMEVFEGVLIATTNLPESMDSAFSRRFDHKIEFRRPGPEERLRLWQLHIPKKVPLDENIDLKELSIRYDLSGGQISLIVMNAITRAARNGDRLTQEDLVWACRAELAGSFDSSARVSIGFSA